MTADDGLAALGFVSGLLLASAASAAFVGMYRLAIVLAVPALWCLAVIIVVLRSGPRG